MTTNKVFIVHALKGKEIGGAAIIATPSIKDALSKFTDKHPLVTGDTIDIYECKELQFKGFTPCIVADYIFNKKEDSADKVFAVRQVDEDNNTCGAAFVAASSEEAALRMICRRHPSATDTQLKLSEITCLDNTYTSATIIIDEIEEV